MDKRTVDIWYDGEADLLEVMFERREGYFRDTDDEHVMEKVDEAGNLLGFSIMGLRRMKQGKVQVALT